MKQIFNEDQKNFIINNYQLMNDTEIAKALGEDFTREQVTGWRNYNGYKHERRMNNIFSEKDIEFIKNNYKNMSYLEIANILGYTERQIRGKINGIGLTKNRKINEHYFDIIDTSLKAYFLGFIFADGWIVYNEKSRNYEFGMELQSGDKYILEKLNQELGGLNTISHINPHTVFILGQEAHSGHIDKLRVYSKNLVLGLMSNGIDTNKTLKDTHPNVSDELFFDFLRGYIDGDGCFWKYKNHYYMHITCACENVLKYIQDCLIKFGIDTKLYKETDRKYRLMCINTNEMKKLVNRLYPNKYVFCLQRKIKLVTEYLNGSAA